MLELLADGENRVSAVKRISSRNYGSAMVHRGWQPETVVRKLVAPLSIIFAIAAVYIVVSQRSIVVRAMPGTAMFFKAIGLPVNIFQAEFLEVRANIQIAAGARRLIVEGKVRNLKSDKNPIPDVQIATLGENGATTYSWVVTLPEKMLDPGESVKFRASLDNPPAGQENVILSFARASGT